MRKIYLLICIMLVAATSFAQVTTSSISGKVVDDKGQPVIGAAVVAVHATSGTQYGGVSDTKGHYRLSNLRPGGPYTVQIQMLGYKGEEYKGIELDLADTYTLNSKLSEESMNIGEVVVSAAGISNMSSDRAGIITTINAKGIAMAPTISRSMNDIMRLNPQSSTTSNGFAVGGGNYRQSYVTVDGASFNNSFGIGSNLPAGNSPISLDALDQISVSVTPYDVRQSGFTGGAINAVTKSGDNEVRASAYTYFNTDNMKGNRVGDETINKVMSNNTLWGVRIGAPIVKDKLFIFANFEGEQNISPGPTAVASSNGKIGTNINRPTTTFLNDVQKYLMDTHGYDAGAYQGYSIKVPSYRFVARLDWNINKNHKFNVRFSNTQNKYSAGASSSVRPLTSATIYPGSGTGTDSWGNTITANNNRTSQYNMIFKNSRYYQEQNFTSVAAELNSVFGSVGNTLRFTYSRQYEPRTYDGNLFPTVDILDGGAPAATFGLDPFTYGNLRQVDTYIITDEAVVTKGKHTFTAGLQYEFDKSQNGYMQGGAGEYIYNSWDDFKNNKAPSAFLMSFDYNNPGGTSNAAFNYNQFSAYVQDKFDISDNFKLTAGIRFELPIIPTLKDNVNTAFAALEYKDGAKYSTDQTPQSKINVSPRVGFNWDITGNRNLVLRGGTGIFTGRIPFVWLVSAVGNANTMQLQYYYNSLSDTKNTYRPSFITNPTDLAWSLINGGAFGSLPAGAKPERGTVAPLSPTILSKDLQMPSTWKTSLALDVKLPWGILGSFDAIVNKDLRSVVTTNMGLKDPIADGLVISENDVRDFYKDGNYNGSSPYLLENFGGKKGYYYSLTAKFQKNYRDFSAMIAYTYSDSKALSDGIGDQVTSSWGTNTSSVEGTNSHELGYGSYVAPHRVVASVSYKIGGTSLSLFYEGSNLGYFKGTGYSYTRYSYTFASAVVGDRGASNLLYIPGSKAELDAMKFSDKGKYTAQQQKDDYWAYIEQDKYLSSRKGKYTERNGAIMPWRNQFDFKLMQDIPFQTKEGKRNVIQIGLDIMNVGNLLNKNWGTIQQVNRNTLLSRNGDGSLNFNMNGSDRLTETFSNYVGMASTYSMQLSFRYIFN